MRDHELIHGSYGRIVFEVQQVQGTPRRATRALFGQRIGGRSMIGRIVEPGGIAAAPCRVGPALPAGSRTEACLAAL